MNEPRQFDIRNVIRGLLGALFCWAAVSKLANPPEFFGDLLAYQLPMSDALLRATAIVLPWLELLCGLMLLGSFWLRPALGWCGVMFAVFILATGQAWARGLNISCGCFKLEALGLDSMTALAKFVDSVAFAFLRAVACFAITVWLWRGTTGAESSSSAS